jgi:hypothetical protein
LLALLSELTRFDPANKDVYFRAFDGLVTLSIAGYHYSAKWEIALAGLSPARTSTSFTALTGPICARACNLNILLELRPKRAS